VSKFLLIFTHLYFTEVLCSVVSLSPFMISLEKFKIESETLNLSCVSPKLTQMLEFCLEYKLNYPLFEVQRVLACNKVLRILFLLRRWK
jgi:hypothetical protein